MLQVDFECIIFFNQMITSLMLIYRKVNVMQFTRGQYVHTLHQNGYTCDVHISVFKIEWNMSKMYLWEHFLWSLIFET